MSLTLYICSRVFILLQILMIAKLTTEDVSNIATTQKAVTTVVATRAIH